MKEVKRRKEGKILIRPRIGSEQIKLFFIETTAAFQRTLQKSYMGPRRGIL